MAYAIGDIIKLDGLIVDQFTVKASGDVTKGKLYCDDGSGGGLVIATAALSVANKVVMALENHDYSEESTHIIAAVVKGNVACAKVSGSGLAAKGNKVTMSGTSGECMKFVAGDVTGTVNESTVEAALVVDLAVIGYATKTSTDAETVQEMFLGA
jgi:hypothetical protein